MPLVGYPFFTAVEKGGEKCSLVYLDLGFGCDVSAKSGTHFSKSRVQLIVHDDGSREGTAKIGELVHHVQSLSVDGDGGLYVWVTQCWLVHDFSLLSADHQAKVVAGLYELVHAMLHVGFHNGSNESAVIRKQEIIDGANLHLGFPFEPPEVEK